MKTAEEILKECTGHAHGLMDYSTIKAMKLYANQKIDEAANYFAYPRDREIILSLKDKSIMTNEQAKQEAIKKAWIYLIDEIPYKLREKQINQDGYLTTIESPANLCVRQDLCSKIHNIIDWEMWRPKTLDYIDDNNGWIRIEPDGSNLPTSGNFRVYNNNPNIVFASSNANCIHP